MASYLEIVWESFHDIDPRVKDFYLIRNSYPILLILASYLYFCLKLGPWFMESRKPYELKNTILLYNVFQILLSCYLAYWGTCLWYHFNWYCQPIDYTVSPFTTECITAGWWYFFAKISELLDTVFFVLRKKYNQISFLHVFHHTNMAFFTWVGMRYIAGGHGSLFTVINSYVHIVMYTYYLLAGLGPQYQKYLWWKKHVTTVQLVQFGIVFLHNLFPLFTSCSYPKYLNGTLVLYSVFFIYMFGNFYIQTYVKKQKKEDKKKKLSE